MADPVIVKFVDEGLNELASNALKAATATDKLGQSADDTNKEFTQFFEDQKKGHLNLQTDIRKSTDQLAQLIAQGKISVGDENFKKATTAIGEMEKSLKKAQQAVKSMASETRGIDALSQGLRVASSALQGIVGITALFGEKNKDLEKTLIKLNAVMLVGNSIRETAILLTEQNAIKNYASAVAQRVYTIAVGESTGALRIFKLALAATGIGLLIIALGSLITNWKEVTKWIGISSESLSSFGDKIKGVTNAIATFFEGTGKVLADIFKGDFSQAITDAGNIGKQVGAAYVKGIEDSIFEKNLTKTIAKLGFAADLFAAQGEEVQALKKEIEKATVELVQAVSNTTDEEVKKAFNSGKLNLTDLIFGTKDENLQKAYLAFTQAQTNLTKKLKEDQDKLNKLAEEAAKKKAKIEEDRGKREEKLRDDSEKKTAKELDFERKADAERIKAETVVNNYLIKLLDILDERRRQSTIRRIAEDKKAYASFVQQRQAEQKRLETDTKTDEELRQKRAGFAQQGLDFIEGLSSVAQQARDIRFQNELKQLDEKKRKGIINEKEYQKELAKIKNEQAKKQHRADVIQAFLAIPKAILQVITTTPFFTWPFAIPLATALALANAALVASSPVPQFGKGGLIGGKPHSQGGTPINAERNEFIQQRKAVEYYGVDFMKKVNSLQFPKAMTVTQKNRPVYNSTTTNNIGEVELKYMNQYIKQGNDISRNSNSLLKRIAKNTVTKAGYA